MIVRSGGHLTHNIQELWGQRLLMVIVDGNISPVTDIWFHFRRVEFGLF